MFMTLKCSGAADAQEMKQLCATDRLGRPQDESPIACDSCRKKKLRCTREKTACRRCKQRGIRCVYDAALRRRGIKPQSDRVSVEPRGPGHRPQTPGHSSDAIRLGHQEPPTAAPDKAGLSPGIQAAITVATPAPTPRISVSSSAAISIADERPDNRHRNPGALHRALSASLENGNAPGARVSQPAVDDLDPTLFYDFVDDYLTTPHDNLTKLLDPFRPGDHDPIHGHYQGTAAAGDAGSARGSISGRLSAREPGHPQYILPGDLSNMCPSQSRSSTTDSHSSGPAPTSASSSPPHSMDLDNDDDCQDEAEEAEDDCECTETALQVLEEVVMPARGADDWDTMEKKLFALKNNISRCLDLSHCVQCAQESGFSMLVLVIYEKLTTAFEEVARWWSYQVDAPGAEQKSPLRSGKQSWTGLQQQQPGFAMGRYKIDSFEEHRAVFKAIISLQLQRLAKLSLLMMNASRILKWRAHAEHAEALLSRIVKLQDGCPL